MENLKYRPLRMKGEKESKGIARPADKLHAETAELVMEIMNAATSFHKLHLSVTGEGSYAQHMALNDLYEALPELADTIAEGMQGACEVILNYPDKAPVTLSGVDGAIQYIRNMIEEINELQSIMPYSEIVNNLDLIKDVFNTAKYKLIFLS
jgi:DNA-binding ferritin-like protein